MPIKILGKALHNKKSHIKPHDQRPKCNCRKKAERSIEGNCQINDEVYKCDVTRPLKWPVLRCVPPYLNISKEYLLGLYEKLETVTYQNQEELLNKRSELLCKCCHANKFLLKNYTSNDFR